MTSRNDIGPHKPVGPTIHRTYLGPDNTLRGHGALTTVSADHCHVLAQFDDRECGYGYGWHEFALTDFLDSGELRSVGILAAAVTLARETHYHRVSRADVAQRAGCGAGTVNLYFGDMEGLRDAVVAEAVRLGDTDIIAQAIVSKHPAVAGKRVQVLG